jgi:hypothetical protein
MELRFEIVGFVTNGIPKAICVFTLNGKQCERWVPVPDGMEPITGTYIGSFRISPRTKNGLEYINLNFIGIPTLIEPTVSCGATLEQIFEMDSTPVAATRRKPQTRSSRNIEL